VVDKLVVGSNEGLCSKEYPMQHKKVDEYDDEPRTRIKTSAQDARAAAGRLRNKWKRARASGKG
jgi:hypothetical protein